jgi:predicted ATPase
MSRLWRTQGKVARARALVSNAHARFTEGFDTADLTDAKALLDELDGAMSRPPPAKRRRGGER